MDTLATETPPSTPRHIPVAKGLPLLGNLLRMIPNPLEGILAMRRECGPVFYFKVLNKTMLVMSSTDANRFLSEEGKDCIISSEYWRDIVQYWQCPGVLISLDGQPHIDERRLWKHYISREVANSEQPEMLDIIRNCMGLYTHGNPVSVRKFCRTLVTRELSFLFTGEVFQLPENLAQALVGWMKTIMTVKGGQGLPDFLMKLPSFRRHDKQVREFADDLLRRARNKLDQDSLYSTMIKRVDNDPNRDEKELIMILLMPFIAGLDTLANTMTFFFHELLNNPTVLARVRADVDAACEANGGAVPGPEGMRHIPALFGACQETLRRYPVAYGVMRHAGKAFEYQGYPVPAGTQIIFLSAGPHFDPTLFADPYTFDIDRYGPDRAEQRTRYAFSPYGRGPHICLGAAMAESMFMTNAAYLLRHYDFKAAIPGKRYKPVFEPGMGLPDAFLMTVTNRVLPTPST